MSKEVSDIGVIGIAVMGENLILNMESKGFHVSAFNRTVDKVEDFVAGRAKGKNIYGAHTIEDFVSSLKSPRKVMLMVKAGKPVDIFIDLLIPLLSPGDIIIDGGNSHFPDTERRVKYVESKGLLFIGAGVSGGEEGALLGPSIMPGGSPKAWPAVKPIFQGIAAKVDGGVPCCDWVGEGGAGHFVKMIHNGIEYGDMQLIGEAYALLKDYVGLDTDQMAGTFTEWNKGELDSYLIQITADILGYKDADGQPLIDKILDTAGQKGTGKWTVISSAELGQPVSLISEAVYARCISALKEQRLAAAKVLKGPKARSPEDAANTVEQIRRALYASKIISYAQGYMLMKAAAAEYGWSLNYGGIALMWRGGCIIRSRFLGDIKTAFDKAPGLDNLLLDQFFSQAIEANQDAWRATVSNAALAGIPVPAMGTALAFYDAYRSGSLPANLLQAQRDYFGAHTYERVDKPRGEFFHTDWTGHGGSASSGSYNA